MADFLKNMQSSIIDSPTKAIQKRLIQNENLEKIDIEKNETQNEKS